ncbi:MAG: hypothetical protein WCP85_00735 [Mariniphaga sp.]
MKRRILIAAIVPLLFGFVVLQSCTKKDAGNFKIYQSFTEPTLTAPVNSSTLKLGTATTVDLKWASTDQDGDAPIGDVYFGTDPKPPLFKAANAGLTLNVPVLVGNTYYWKVTMKDANGVMTYGPTWSFTIYDPISIYLGAYTVDEPAEAWTYTVNFSKGGANLLKIDKYWASWPAVFTLDYTLLTYTMPLTDFGGGYKAIESGTINATTGKLTGTYIIYENGKNIEAGPHTYTKK